MIRQAESETAGAPWRDRWSVARAGALCLTAALLSPGYVLIGAGLLFSLILAEAAVRRQNPWEPTAIDPLIVLWIGAVTVSALMSEQRVLALLNSALLALAVLIGLAPVVRVLRERPDFWRALYSWWVAGGAVAGGMVVVQFLQGGTGGRGDLPQLGFNAAGTVLLVASLLSLTLFLSGRGRGAYLAAAAQIPILAGLAATMSRGAWLGWVAGGIALLILVLVGARHMQRRAWAAAGVLAAAVVLAGAWQPDLVQRARSALVVEMNRDRLLLWQASWQMFTDNPWWGVGFGAFSYAYPRYRLPDDPNVFATNAHNLPLSIAAETGVFGAVAFLALILVVAWIGVARSLRGPPDNRMLRIGAVAAFTGALAHQMVDATLHSFHLALGFWFLIAIMVALPPGEPRDIRPRGASGTLMTAAAPGHRRP